MVKLALFSCRLLSGGNPMLFKKAEILTFFVSSWSSSYLKLHMPFQMSRALWAAEIVILYKECKEYLVSGCQMGAKWFEPLFILDTFDAFR